MFMLGEVAARLTALESEVCNLKRVLGETREVAQFQHLQIRGLLDFKNAILQHLDLRFETVPETRRLAKR